MSRRLASKSLTLCRLLADLLSAPTLRSFLYIVYSSDQATLIVKEIAPKEASNIIVTMSPIIIVTGRIFANLLYRIYPRNDGTMIILAEHKSRLFFSAAQLVLLLFVFTRDTPKFLYTTGKRLDCKVELKRMYPSQERVSNEFAIVRHVAEQVLLFVLIKGRPSTSHCRTANCSENGRDRIH